MDSNTKQPGRRSGVSDAVAKLLRLAATPVDTRRSRGSSAAVTSENPRFGSVVDDEEPNTATIPHLNETERMVLFKEQENLTKALKTQESNANKGLHRSSQPDDESVETPAWQSTLEIQARRKRDVPEPEEKPPLDGIRLRVLQHVRDFVATITPPKCTMRHAHNSSCRSTVWTNGAVYALLKYFTKSEQFSVASLLRQYPPGSPEHPLLGGNLQDVSEVASVFVSHAWSTSFPTFVESLERYVASPSNSLTPDTATFWIDGFTINQHAPPASENFARAFLAGVRNIPEVVCVLGSWRNPVPLTRVWCLWEIMGSILHEKPFHILFTEQEERDLLDTLVVDFESIIGSLCKIDAAKAQATVESDKTMIMDAIKAQIPNGILGVNQRVLDPLRAWLSSVSERELTVLHKTTSVEDPVILTFMSNLGMLYYSQGIYSKAEALYTEALEASKRVLGDEDPKTLGLINNLGMLYYSQGLYWKVETLYVTDALEASIRVLGKEHPQTLSFMNNLAAVYDAQGLYSKAQPLYEETLEVRKRVLGEEDPATLMSMNNLGMSYSSLGLYLQAEPLFVKTLEVRKRVLGEDHPETLVSMNNLGKLYDSQGLYSKAEELYVRSLEARKRVFGEEHPDTLLSMNNLAGLYYSQGLYSKAVPLYEENLAVRKRMLGEEHPDTLVSMNNLGISYNSMGLYSKAEALYEQALAVSKRVLGDEHPDTCIYRGNLERLRNKLKYS